VDVKARELVACTLSKLVCFQTEYVPKEENSIRANSARSMRMLLVRNTGYIHFRITFSSDTSISFSESVVRLLLKL
jgi:hypothetical protein